MTEQGVLVLGLVPLRACHVGEVVVVMAFSLEWDVDHSVWDAVLECCLVSSQGCRAKCICWMRVVGDHWVGPQ